MSASLQTQEVVINATFQFQKMRYYYEATNQSSNLHYQLLKLTISITQKAEIRDSFFYPAN
jgi:hypothetical protein